MCGADKKPLVLQARLDRHSHLTRCSQRWRSLVPALGSKLFPSRDLAARNFLPLLSTKALRLLFAIVLFLESLLLMWAFDMERLNWSLFIPLFM